MSLKITTAVAIVTLIILGSFLFGKSIFKNKPTGDGVVCTQDAKICPDGSAVGSVPPAAVKVIAQNLEIPWGLAFLPDKSMLFTERPGRVRMIDREGNLLSSPLTTISEVKHIGEGGLLGIAIHPNFASNKYVYLYYTYSRSGDNTLNKVARFKFEDGKLVNEQIMIDNIPGASNHNGGRIKFGPDNFLYITTGDAQDPSQAQDRNSLAGKILRVTDEGKPAPSNPFNNLVYSYGHRNPQGITWDSNGVLWETEHGSSTMDEFNKIEAGGNYGWPEIRGDQKKAGMEQPFSHSGDNTWAPAGAAYYRYSKTKYSIFFAGLRGEALYEMELNQGNSLLRTHFEKEFGRIRDVVLGLDNYLYITTSNRDGRGNLQAGDDKIIKIDPKKI